MTQKIFSNHLYGRLGPAAPQRFDRDAPRQDVGEAQNPHARVVSDAGC